MLSLGGGAVEIGVNHNRKKGRQVFTNWFIADVTDIDAFTISVQSGNVQCLRQSLISRSNFSRRRRSLFSETKNATETTPRESDPWKITPREDYMPLKTVISVTKCRGLP